MKREGSFASPSIKIHSLRLDAGIQIPEFLGKQIDEAQADSLKNAEEAANETAFDTTSEFEG